MKLTAISDTIFKLRVKPSRELPTEEKLLVNKGSEFEIVTTESALNKHLKVILNSPIGLQNERVWYVFKEHVALLGNEANNHPNENEDLDVPQELLDGFMVPGYPYRFYMPDPVLHGGSFTWADVTKNGRRIPTSKKIVDNILQMADSMQDIRELLGHRPVKIISWYRDMASNQRIGASPRSLHLVGGAVDFSVAGVSPAEVQQRLGPWWGSQGGLASGSNFTHIDNRGYRARWRYDR